MCDKSGEGKRVIVIFLWPFLNLVYGHKYKEKGTRALNLSEQSKILKKFFGLMTTFEIFGSKQVYVPSAGE